MRPSTQTLLNAIDASVAGPQPSAAVPLEFIFRLSVQTIAVGAPVGVVKLQVSNDPPHNGHAPANWTDLPSATSSVGAAGTFLIQSTEVCYNWLRAVYTKTSGTGSITVNLKELGE